MDFSKFKTSDWLKVGGGLVMLIAGFLTWWQPSCDGAGTGTSACEAAVDNLGLDVNAFDLTFTGLLPWFLIVAIGVLTFLAVQGIFKLPASLPAPLIFLAASALSVLLVLIRVFADPFDSGLVDNDSTERGFGLYLGFLAAAAVAAGCFLGFKESGGDINDLKDMNKLKASFGGGAAAAPGSVPPPPPGMAPPPPPPPAPGTPPPPPPPPPMG